MSLVGILSAGNTPQLLSAYSFQHARDHDDIDAALLTLGFPPVRIPLDPMPDLKQAQFWLLLHYQKHIAMNTVLGLQGDDLTKFDLSQPENLAGFVGSNYSEHDSVYQTLSNLGLVVGEL